MSYREPQPASVIGPTRTIAWVLIVLGIASLVFLTWHQIIMISVSRKYGIETSWFSSLLFFLAFTALEAVAVYAAYKRHYGVSAAFGGFVFAFLGFTSLIVLGGVGM